MSSGSMDKRQMHPTVKPVSVLSALVASQVHLMLNDVLTHHRQSRDRYTMA